MSQSLNPNVYPKDGYLFQDKDGAKIYGQNWNGVIARVVAYRRRAGYEAGDPLAEVIAQACARQPVLCVQSNPVNEAQLKVASLKSRILGWLAGVRARRDAGEPPGFVNDAMAQERANICATCPRNTALPGGCGSCNAALKEIRQDILGTRPIDGRLSGCIVTGEDLPVTIYFNQTTVENGELPGHCWRKRTLL